MGPIPNINQEVCLNLINNLEGVFFRRLPDPNHTMIYLSPQCRILTGYEPCEFISNKSISFSSLIHPDDREKLDKEYCKNIQQKLPLNNEYRIINNQGVVRWVKEIAKGIYNQMGELLFVDGYLQDITAEKDAIQLSDSFLSYQKAINSGVCISITDLNGDIIFANDLFCYYSKYTLTELLGRNHRIVNSGHHSKDFYQDLWSKINSGKPWRGELKNKAKDNSLYWIAAVIVPMFNKDGKIIQFLAITSVINDGKEVEERMKESEARFRTLFERNLAGVYRADLNDVIIECNDAYANLIGFNSAGDVVGKHARELYDNLSHANFLDILQSKGGKIMGYECQVQLKNGKLVFTMENASIFNGNDGKPAYVEGTVIDITERKESEDKMKLNFKEISNAEKINQSILRGDTIIEISNLLLKALDELTGVKLSRIYRYEESGGTLELLGQNVENGLQTKIESKIGMILAGIIPTIEEGSLFKEIIEQKQNIITNDNIEINKIIQSHISDVYIKNLARRAQKFINFNTFGILPLIYKDKLVGLITFASTDILNENIKQTIIRFSHHSAIVIAKLKREDKLAEAQSQLKFINDNSPDLLITINKNLIIMYVNYSNWTLPNINMVGSNILDLVSDDLSTEYNEHITNAFNGIPQEFEIPGYKYDFHLVWYSVRMTGIKINDKIETLLIISTNITDKKLADEKIKISEERFRTLFERNLAGVYRASLDDVIVECNDSFAKLIGYNSANEVVGKHARELYANLSLEDFVNNVQGKNGKITGYESLIELKNGKQVYILENASLILDEKNEPAYMEGTVIDITERKEAERAFLKSQQRYKMLLNNMNDGFLVDDVKGNVTYTNNRFRIIFGLEKSDLEHLKLEDYIAPEYRELLRDRHDRRVGGEQMPDDFEYQGIRKDGSKIWLETHVNTIVENGNIIGTQSVVKDITDKKNKSFEFKKLAELNLKIIDSSDELFYVTKVTDKKSIFNPPIYLSNKANDFFGYDSEYLIKNLDIWFNLIHPEDKEQVIRITNELYKTRKPVIRIYRMKNDALAEYIWIYDFVKPVLNAAGEIEEFYGAMKNITELKNRETELEKTAKYLNDRCNELMQFNYIVSHNLRAPVANIMGMINVFQMPDISENEKLLCLEYIDSASQKMDEVIKDLNLILETRSALNEKKEQISIPVLLNSITQTLQKQINESGTVIKTYLNDDAEDIFTIKGYLESILYNLISNAIKYKSKTRIPEIILSSKKEVDELILSVADNGTGIDLQKFDKQIFGLYKRFNNEVEGKGLGLFMTKTQVETLGGRITVESEMGLGSKFIFTLPL